VTPAADPREIGELLGTYLGIKLDQVDDLVNEARDRADAIPSWRTMAEITGELVIRLTALEREVGDLKREAADRKKRGRP
jgi:hypothetical protein